MASGSGAGNTSGGKPARKPLAAKNLKKGQVLNSLIRSKGSDSKGAALMQWWNRTWRTKAANEMKRGWLKEAEKAKGPDG